MKRRDERAAARGGVSEKAADTLSHLVRGFVCEGYGKHSWPRHMMRGDHVGYSVRNDAGLSAASAGQQKHRTFQVRDSFTLLRIKTFQEIHQRRECDFRIPSAYGFSRV